MKKLLSILLMMIFMLSALPAFAASEPVTLSLWHRWSGPNEAALLEVVAAFEAANPQVKIEVTGKPGEYFELLQKMIADMAAGVQPPDMFVGGYNLLNYITTELDPVPVDQIAPSAEAYQSLVDRFDPAIWALANAGGAQVGVPYALSNIVTFYNKDLFAAAGLSDADVPATWDKMDDVGQVIKDKTGKYAFAMQKVDSWPDLAMIYSNGGQLLSEDGEQVAFNNPEAVEAISIWQNLYKQGLAPICTDDEQMASFIAGDIAIYTASVMKLSSLKNSAAFDVGVAMFPAFGDKPRKLPAGGAAVISFTADTQAKRDAIWAFMDFATTDEQMTTFTKTGYLCVTKGKVPVAQGQEAGYEQIPFAVQWTAWPGGSAGLEIDRQYIDTRLSLIHGDGDVQSAYDKLVETCNDLL